MVEALPPSPVPGFDSAWLVRVPIALIGDDPDELELHPDEVIDAARHKPRRRRELIAGRTALRRALRQAGWIDDAPLLPGEQGRPEVPMGFTGSITHKEGAVLAVAAKLVAGRTLGIDSEVLGTRPRVGIASRILRPVELARWRAGGESWPLLLEAFSLKEAIYKAMHPHVPRYIRFDEAEISADGAITMHLAGGEGPFVVTGRSWWEGERLISVVSCRAAP